MLQVATVALTEHIHETASTSVAFIKKAHSVADPRSTQMKPQ